MLKQLGYRKITEQGTPWTYIPIDPVNGKAAEQLGKKRRCKHDNFLQITKNGTVLCIAQSLHNSL